MQSFIVQHIAAAAGQGFADAHTRKAPRSAAAWVAHCRNAAHLAAEALRRDPPPRLLTPSGKTLRSLVRKLEAIDPEPDYVPWSDPDERLDGEDLELACRAAAAAAFRGVMPLLVSKGAVRFYIACVAAGTQDGHLTASEGKSLLYSAQLALAAYKSGDRKSRAKVSHAGPVLVQGGSTGTHGPPPR